MNVAAHILCFNEAEFLPFALRHYRTFCNTIIVHDLGSTDGSQAIAHEADAIVNQHDCRGEFDDRLNKRIKETEWRISPADWSIMADCDELIYFPMGAESTIAAYEKNGTVIVKPYGYEMFSDEYPKGPGQAYEEVKTGARDDYWYGKPILFRSAAVRSIEFSTGSHTAKGSTTEGRVIEVGHKSLDARSPRSSPACYLLHFHHIGGLDRIGRLYEENRNRQAAINKQMKWGLQEPGPIHAKRKRDLIVPRLERVIP